MFDPRRNSRRNILVKILLEGDEHQLLVPQIIEFYSSNSTEPKLDKVICPFSEIYLEWMLGLGSLLEPHSLGPLTQVGFLRGNLEKGIMRPWTNMIDDEYS